MRKCKLGEYIQIKHGYPFKSEYFSSEGEYIILTPGNFYEEGGFKRTPGKEKFYANKFPQEYLCKKDDLIVVMTEQVRGLLGSTALVPEDNVFLHNQRIGLISYDEKHVSRDFLNYLFRTKSVRSQLEGSASGTKIKHTSPDRICAVEVELPEIDEQNKIGKLLKIIDDKIDNNKLICNQLESMAKTLYDYWFVQFDFPDANGNPYKTSGGKMEWNETLSREIPAGWGCTKLEKYFEIGNGKDHSKLEDGIYPVYGSGGLMRRVNKFLCNEESVLIPRKGTLNNVMHVSGEFWTVDTMYYTKMKRGNIADYVYQTVKLFDFEKLNTGSALPSMTASIIYSLQVPDAPASLIEKYETYASENFSNIQLIEKENRTLKSLRDFLLPMLMNGQVIFS